MDSKRNQEPYMEEDRVTFDEDEFVVADMSNLELQPMLVPRLDTLYKRKRGEEPAANEQHRHAQTPEYLDREGRWAMIKGALAAVFLLIAILAASFAGLILLINALWG